jgi:RsiW-degrading membrane proteinase PrsW (M82 family)
MNGCEADIMFATKGLMKQKPWTVLIYGLLSTTALWGFMLRIFEAPLDEATGQEFSSM